MSDEISAETNICTCKNRTLHPTEAIMWVGPNLAYAWVTAKDCPVHGMRDLTVYHGTENVQDTDVECNVDY